MAFLVILWPRKITDIGIDGSTNERFHPLIPHGASKDDTEMSKLHQRETFPV